MRSFPKDDHAQPARPTGRGGTGVRTPRPAVSAESTPLPPSDRGATTEVTAGTASYGRGSGRRTGTPFPPYRTRLGRGFYQNYEDTDGEKGSRGALLTPSSGNRTFAIPLRWGEERSRDGGERVTRRKTRTPVSYSLPTSTEEVGGRTRIEGPGDTRENR